MSIYVVNKYQRNFELLIQSLNTTNRKVIAFLGAGVSREDGYQTWDELIRGSRSGKNTSRGLVDAAKLTDEEYNKYRSDRGKFDLHGLAQECYDKMGKDRWEKFVSDTYDNTNEIQIKIDSHPLDFVFRTRYFSFITTNFDGVVYKYGINRINKLVVQVYPKNLIQPEELNLCYLHGAGFGDIDYYSPQIILTKKDYQKAYEKPSQLNSFLHELIYYDLVFIGFSLNDYYLLKYFEELEELRLSTKRHNKELDPRIFDREKFVILSNTPNRIGKIDNETVNTEEILRDEDNSISSRGIHIIRYNILDGEVHKAFPMLMRDIYKKAGNKSLSSQLFAIKDKWKFDES